MLEETYAALADAAGSGQSAALGSETGVYMGCINYEYTEVLERGGAKAWPRAMTALCRPASTPQIAPSNITSLVRGLAHDGMPFDCTRLRSALRP